MFGFKKRDSQEREAMERIQRQQEQFNIAMEQHSMQYDKAVESQKKASNLMQEAATFIVFQAANTQSSDQHEQAKKRLTSCLVAVREDELLKENSEVQNLVDDIYKNMDDIMAMKALMPRLGVLVNTPSVPAINISARIGR